MCKAFSLNHKFSVKKKMKKFFYKLISSEKSVQKLALSFCVGNFIAWTPVMPLIPIQTILIFIFSWLFKLNTAVTFATVYLINNPFTMVPIAFIDYLFGCWLMNCVFKIDLMSYNPAWVDSFSAALSKYIDLSRITSGGSLCFWCLIIGGIVLPLILSLILYPIMRLVFSLLIKKLDHNREKIDENYNTK